MSHSKLRKTGHMGVVFAGSAVLMPTWGLPAQAEPGGEGGLKLNASPTQELQFASCMRRHGVPSFPGPNADGVFPFQGNSLSPQFQAAQKVCSGLAHLPGPPSPAEQAKLTEQALVFAKCMRSHGVPNFPEPGNHGGNGTSSTSGAGGNSAFFQRAEQACRKLAPDGSLPAPVPS